MSRRALHHLALGAHDVERVADFYREAFDLPEIARHLNADASLRSIWLDLGGAILMIEQTDGAPRSVEGRGLFLMALRVSAAERAPAEARLERAGAVIESRTAFTAYARDPEGNRVALSHYPDPHHPELG